MKRTTRFDALTRCELLAGQLGRRLRRLETMQRLGCDPANDKERDEKPTDIESSDVIDLDLRRARRDPLDAEAVICRQIAAEISSWSPLSAIAG